jgi:hypothetical protein
MWDEDDRVPRLFPFVRAYAAANLRPTEQWIPDILSSFAAKTPLLNDVELFLPEQPYGSTDTVARLAGHLIKWGPPPEGEKQRTKDGQEIRVEKSRTIKVPLHAPTSLFVRSTSVAWHERRRW